MATPGRFLHVMMEMDLKLTAVEYVVFDEADRYNITLEYKYLFLATYTSLYRIRKNLEAFKLNIFQPLKDKVAIFALGILLIEVLQNPCFDNTVKSLAYRH